MTDTSNGNTQQGVQQVARNPNLVEQIREGMNVSTSDGQDIGTVVRVWQCTDPAEGVLSNIMQSEHRTYEEAIRTEAGTFVEVQSATGEELYIPWQGVRAVDGDCLCLEVDAPSVNHSAWRLKPSWIDG